MKTNTKIWLVIALSFVIGGLISACICTWTFRHQQVSTIRGWYKLNLILDQVEKNYVDSIDRSTVTDAAALAAVQALDPHSLYMKPEPLKEADIDLSGEFEGVGLQFNVPSDTAIVLNVIAGGPSQKAGLLSGDRILKVNERVIAGNKTPQDTMVRLMRGPKGSKVTLTIGRGNERIPFCITRDVIPENSIAASFMIDKTTGYIRLSKFSRTAYHEFLDAASKLRDQGMTKLIFDFRDNTGGYYDQACLLANEFLREDELIVYMQGRHRKRTDQYSDGSGRFQDMDLRVLIDDGSASASEIFAGAIQDNDRGIVVGRRSFGKGLVQEPIYFSDGSGIRLTVARYYTPSGRCIQKPYDKADYNYDLYERYNSGELVNADSIKVDSSKVYKTRLGRIVYGGGGIIPDIFVPMDTTRATNFHIECNKKALTMRYAAHFMDKHRSALLNIDNFDTLKAYLDSCPVEQDFLSFAASLGIKPAEGEWEKSKEFLMPQILGLCGRYSNVGEQVYYKYIIPQDDVIQAALKQ